jgi:hypothetical protein
MRFGDYIREGYKASELDYIRVTKSKAENKEFKQLWDILCIYNPSLEDDADFVKGKYLIAKEDIWKWKAALKDASNIPSEDPDTNWTIDPEKLKILVNKYKRIIK